jgi:serine kinase of HPr protein (carbohydrate metabolism regulator)
MMADTIPRDSGELVHASCVLVGETGLLLRGPSGAGKSDLALRLIDRGAMLVGDDYVRVEPVEGRLCATVADRIAGLIEVRGVGIVTLPHRPTATIGLVIDLIAEPIEEERLPFGRETAIAGVTLPLYRLNPFPASAPIKVELWVTRLKDRL